MQKYGKAWVERDFTLPTGNVVDYVLFGKSGGSGNPAIIMPVTKDGYIIAVEQFRFGANDFVIELPGGNTREGESIVETIQQELQSEAGIASSEIQILQPRIWIDPASSPAVMIPIVALNCTCTGMPDPEPTEILEVVKIPTADFYAEIHSGRIRDCKTVALAYLAMPLLQKRGLL